MKSLLALAIAGALAACSTLRPETAPGCHGQLRPANPYGSVLADPTPAATAATPAPTPTASGSGPCGGDRP